MLLDVAWAPEVVQETVMSTSSTSILDLLRLCIAQGQTGPWEGMLAAIGELVESIYRAEAPAHQAHLLGDFRAWLPGWLVEGQRLRSAHAWLEEQIRDGKLPTINDQERALRNYLQKTIGSGFGDYFRERSGRSAVTRSQRSLEREVAESLQARPDRISAEDQDRLSQVKQRLAELPLTLRVLFRLRFYETSGPLSSEELAWVSVQSGLSVDQVEQMIRDELQNQPGAEFPLSAEFIGRLLQIPSGADGRFTTVDKRVSRARQRLREQFQQEADSQ